MIRAVIFDWGGVLIDDIAAFFVNYSAYHLHVRREDMAIQINQYISDFGKGMISEDVFWGKICEAMSIETPHIPSLWGEALRAGYSEKRDVFKLIDRLKDRGYKIGLLSNCEMPAVEFFSQESYAQFDAAVFSCKEGICKPDKRIYEIALHRLDVDPYEAVFIDDKEENVRAARDTGLYGIVFVSPEQIREELEFLLGEEIG